MDYLGTKTAEKSIAVKEDVRLRGVSSVLNITKNTDLAISAPNPIVLVTVFNPVTGRLINVQPTLVANRLSGTLRITQNINNAQVTIITT